MIAINQSLWLDEAVQVWASQNFDLTNLITQYMPGDFNPPLYYLLTWLWTRMFGAEEWVTRLLPVLLGTASIYVFFKILKKLDFTNSNVQIASLLLATSPLHIYYSHENRTYMLASLAVLLTFYTFLNYLNKQSTTNFAFFSLSLIIMSFSHFLTLFTLPIFFIYGFIKLNKKIIHPFIPLIIAYFIYIPLLFKQLKTGLEWQKQYPIWQSTVGSFSLKAVLLLPVKFTIGRISWQPQWFYFLVGGLITALFWLAALVPAKNFKKHKVQLVYALLFIPPLIGLIISPWISVFSYFRFLFVLPFFYAAFSLARTVINKKVFRILAVFFIAVNIICSLVYLFNPNYHRENWRGMVNWLHCQNTQDSPVIVLSQINKPFMYYDDDQSQTIYVSQPNKFNLKLQDENTIYLVSYGLPIFDPNDIIRHKLKAEDLRLKAGESFRKVGIEVWEK